MEPVWTVVEVLHKTAVCCLHAAHAQVRLRGNCVRSRAVLEKVHWVNNAWKDILTVWHKNSPLKQTLPGCLRWIWRTSQLFTVAMEKSSLCLQRWPLKERCKENKLSQSVCKKAQQIISSQNTAENTKCQIMNHKGNILVWWKHSENACWLSHQVYYVLKEFLVYTHRVGTCKP